MTTAILTTASVKSDFNACNLITRWFIKYSEIIFTGLCIRFLNRAYHKSRLFCHFRQVEKKHRENLYSFYLTAISTKVNENSTLTEKNIYQALTLSTYSNAEIIIRKEKYELRFCFGVRIFPLWRTVRNVNRILISNFELFIKFIFIY